MTPWGSGQLELIILYITYITTFFREYVLKTMKRRLSTDMFIPMTWQRVNNNQVGVVEAGNQQPLDRVVVMPKTRPIITTMERPNIHSGILFFIYN